ncbi:hypothetical protein NEIMUCOT_03759 [Neisseria mucosa ATCC 25996]|jgi:hypothetical protein|uniref:Uncharacterized protein n=1 Tax=Neisseria mucosa (strain ATCC 25996 / DSM 4631 / NCTC 10774 / M26) TaxID=546266 RepID=D2ZT26_NEIM2|nr:hypothetical protein [Neisseria mucosa]EFC89959.1 hypothetical protein NEIMUCOT_03759 [Neisseria mucosa ATCC 25996]SUA37321.1 Uncharacterised protein [Neisseria mucosa]
MKDIEVCILMNLAEDICEFLELRAGSYIIPHPEFNFPRHDDPEICYVEAGIAKKYQEQFGLYLTKGQFGLEAGFDIAEIAKQFKERFAAYFETLTDDEIYSEYIY